MKGRGGLGGIAILLVLALAGSAGAETVELVTYYPTAANTGDLHVGSLTVGDELRGDAPPDGVALIFDELGIGLPPGTTDPAGPLHVVGVNGVVSSAVFMPGTGAGSAMWVGIGRLAPRVALDVQGSLMLEDANGAGVIYFRNTQVNPAVPVGLYIRSDDNPATFEAASERMFIGANGNVGIGRTDPGVRLDVVGRAEFRRGTTPATGISDVIALNPDDPNVGLELVSGTTGGTPYIDFRNDVAADFDMRFQLLDNDDLLVEGGRLELKRDSAPTSPFRLNEIELDPFDPNVGIELRSGSSGGTPYIDFSNDATSDSDARIILMGNDELQFKGTRVGVEVASTSPARYKFYAAGIRNASARTLLEGMDGAGYHWIMAGGDTEATNTAMAFRWPARIISVGSGWTTSGFSSVAYKKDISRLSALETAAILSKIRRTDVVRFRYRSEPSDAKLRLGVIAEQAPEEILDATGQGVSFMDFDAFLMAGVKALDEENRQLRAELADLKRAVEQLKRQLRDRP